MEEAWLGSVGGAEFLFELERRRTHFLGFYLLLGGKKGRRTRFPGPQISHLPGSGAGKSAGAREDNKTVLPKVDRNGRTCSAGGLKEKVDMSRSKVEFMYFVW